MEKLSPIKKDSSRKYIENKSIIIKDYENREADPDGAQ